MIASISISKLAPGHDSVHVDDMEAGVTYESIAAAISDHSDIPPVYAQFVNIHYHGVQLATMSVSRMQSCSHELAADLIQLSAEIHAAQ